MYNLDIQSILKSNHNSPVKIGELTQDVIDKLNLNCSPRSIFLTPDRIYHCENHKYQYSDNASYEECLSNIPSIIERPDYIGFNQNHNSIQYVKKLSDTILVAIRIFDTGPLRLRTIFPITEFYLKNKIKSKKLIPYK